MITLFPGGIYSRQSGIYHYDCVFYGPKKAQNREDSLDFATCRSQEYKDSLCTACHDYQSQVYLRRDQSS